MRRRLITLAGIITATFTLGAGVVFAINNDSIVSGTTNKTIYQVGRDVVITGTVNGDVFCAGQTVNVDATVNGDVICAAQTVTVNGTVNGNVRLAGQTVNLGADVKRAASLAGQDVTVQNNARIGSDLSLAANTANVDGRVGRDISGATHTLILTNTVGRNVDARVAKLELQSSAVINGNLTYTAPVTTDLHNAGGKVLGSQTFHKAPNNKHAMRWGAWFAWHVYVSVALAVLSLVLVAVFPRAINRWNKQAESHFWPALGVGFVSMFVVPLIIVALFISLVGIPLGILVLLSWLAAMLLTAPLAAYYVGSRITPSEKRIPLVMLVGVVVLAVVCQIPFLGWVVTVIAYWLGLGVVLLNVRNHFLKPNYRR
jgi:cytoskeletal protein CcmA (bactofilin family)